MRAPLVAVVTSMPLVRRLPRRVRTALLVVHVATSAGWLGLDGALVALQVTGLHSGDPAARPGIAIAMAAIACWVLIPVVFAALCSGLVLALGTPWGLARHWWVLAKSGIAVVLTTTGAALMLPHLPPVFAGESELGGVQTLAARSRERAELTQRSSLGISEPADQSPPCARSTRMPSMTSTLRVLGQPSCMHCARLTASAIFECSPMNLAWLPAGCWSPVPAPGRRAPARSQLSDRLIPRLPGAGGGRRGGAGQSRDPGPDQALGHLLKDSMSDTLSVS
jgi:hypothetical protein